MRAALSACVVIVAATPHHAEAERTVRWRPQPMAAACGEQRHFDECNPRFEGAHATLVRSVDDVHAVAPRCDLATWPRGAALVAVDVQARGAVRVRRVTRRGDALTVHLDVGPSCDAAPPPLVHTRLWLRVPAGATAVTVDRRVRPPRPRCWRLP
ncbi:MAG: hypothetical protein JNK64_34850 [Myxococcales bacterium]|nr:hypothetical protein [Myxococcales bacterium]